jgi:RHS repeat-associated protein
VGENTVSYTWDLPTGRQASAAGLPVVLQDSDGNSYVYGLDLISVTDDNSVQTYFLYDGLGSTTDLAADDGTVTGTYAYDAFGPVRAHTGATTQWTYTGEQNDPTGLEYLRARYYDPASGRFLGRDPLVGSAMAPLSLNRYAYVLNNPLRCLDPWGLRNVEGTPTPTPSNQYLVCRAVRGQNRDCQYLLPSGGRGIWGDVGDVIGDVWGAYKAYYRHTPDYLVYQHVVRPALEFATSRSPRCYVQATILGIYTAGLIGTTPEGAPIWANLVLYGSYTGFATNTGVACSQ